MECGRPEVFIQKNYLLLYGIICPEPFYTTYIFAKREWTCQKGVDDIVEDGLYGGTSKVAKGFAAGKVFLRMKNDGLKVGVNWQDADSSSAKACASVFST